MIDSMRPPRRTGWVDELLARGNYRGCDYNFTNLYVWSRAYNQRIARVDDFLVTHVCGRWVQLYVPCGLRRHCCRHPCAGGRRGGEGGAPAPGVPHAPADGGAGGIFPRPVAYTADRDGYDYLYEVERLAELGGKKLHAKRNHINRFVENNPTWTYEEITPATLPECLEMDKEWYRRSLQREGDAEERDLGDEGIALRTAMEHYEELGLEGGLIRVYGEVVAFGHR